MDPVTYVLAVIIVVGLFALHRALVERARNAGFAAGWDAAAGVTPDEQEAAHAAD